MIAKAKTKPARVRTILSALGIPMAKKAELGDLTPEQKRIRSAAPLYVTDEQLATLETAATEGWTGHAIVVSLQHRLCTVAIQKDGNVAWVMPDGRVDSELLMAKRALAYDAEQQQRVARAMMEGATTDRPAPNGNGTKH